MAEGTFKIMVYLDTLFDTRLGTMSLIHDDYAVEALCNVYSERVTDDTATYCPGLDFALFKKAYAKRNTATLQNSHATTFAMALGAILRSIETKLVCGSPFHNKFELIINEAPYDLSEEERAGIRNSIVSFTKLKHGISFTKIPVAALTLEKIKSLGLNTIHLYEYDEWYSSIFDNKPLIATEANIVVPALFLDVQAMKNLMELKKDRGDEPDPMHETTVVHAEWIMIEFTDPAIYTISPHFLIPDKDDGNNKEGK